MKKNTIFYFIVALMVSACSSALTDEPLQESAKGDPENVNSKYISPCEAGEIASLFMKSLDSEKNTTRASEHSVASVRLFGDLTKTRASEGDTTFYVVNFKEGGYSVVAAEKGVENPVYVYSQTGTVTYPLHPVMEDYLEKVAVEIPKSAKRVVAGNSINGIVRKPAYPDSLPPAGGVVEINGVRYIYRAGNSHGIKGPLLKTQWGQDDPYNYFCPLDELGRKTLTCCVSTAIGQICGYHKWPTQLDGYTFNWDEMLSTPTKSNINDSGAYYIAKLLRILGQKSEVEYGFYLSSASPENALKCIKEIGYASAKNISYSTTACISHINLHGPLFMYGYDEEINNTTIIFGRMGHAWVVDGYDSCTYYIDYFREDNGEFFRRDDGGGYCYLHFNLGWNGQEDAFYLMNGSGTSANQNKFSEFEYNKDNYLITDIKR